MSVTSRLFLLLLLDRGVKWSPSGVGNCPEEQSVCLSMLFSSSAAPHFQLRPASIWTDLRAAGPGSLAILVIFLVIRWLCGEARVLGVGRSGFAFQSCLCKQVGWPLDGQCRSVPQFPQRGIRTIASNCCEVFQCREKMLECNRLSTKNCYTVTHQLWTP